MSKHHDHVLFFDGHGVTEGEPQSHKPLATHTQHTPTHHTSTQPRSHPNHTTPSHADEPSQAKPSQAKPSRTVPHDTTPHQVTPRQKQAPPKKGQAAPSQVIKSRPFPVQGECSLLSLTLVHLFHLSVGLQLLWLLARIGLKIGVMTGSATGWKIGPKTGLGTIQRSTRVNGTMVRIPIWCVESPARVQI